MKLFKVKTSAATSKNKFQLNTFLSYSPHFNGLRIKLDNLFCIQTDSIQKKPDSDFGVKISTIKFYVIEHNFQLDNQIEMKILQEFLDML